MSEPITPPAEEAIPQLKKMQSVRRIPGLTLFKINYVTGEVTECLIPGQPVPQRIIIEKDCIYMQALNKKTAIKKYKKMIAGFIKQSTKPKQ